ncbi:hypothetical protein BC939DRAFT_327495 [Gamsiella multidivaricata]|uniref:uncharacterized protein n=1 Tax=Gamsiella multidivaricata TaxID=101098 RepID=UPI00221E7A92|nr:uncharacterized protein BC939DRAFT_327495 [Gamsiella multidivaricata]KAI7817530.1 hypothetical protein BC939DRAFT_327495 [Gamsiella multidivaricata]
MPSKASQPYCSASQDRALGNNMDILTEVLARLPRVEELSITFLMSLVATRGRSVSSQQRRPHLTALHTGILSVRRDGLFEFAKYCSSPRCDHPLDMDTKDSSAATDCSNVHRQRHKSEDFMTLGAFTGWNMSISLLFFILAIIEAQPVS